MKDRKSVIRRIRTDNAAAGEDAYVVDLYEQNRLVQTRELPGKSLRYAEDLAENWETGVIQLLTE